MLYLIAIALSLLVGFVCGFLFYRKNYAKIKTTEDRGKQMLDALKGRQP
jgi:uncharacterized protein YneF (UPF0154 family)